ncbi:MAG: accessory gene regulator ArgB-like protein [Bacillota bacterium]
MSYSKFSTSIADYISREIKLDDEKRLVVAYAIENLLLSILGFFLILLVGALFGAALPAAITALSGGLLRRLSGGAHASTPLKCMLYSSLGYGLVAAGGYHLSKLIVINNLYLMLVLLFSLLIVTIYAPVDCPAKRIYSVGLRKRLKTGSICFVLLNMALVMFIDLESIKLFMSLGTLVQTFTLFPFFNKN